MNDPPNNRRCLKDARLGHVSGSCPLRETGSFARGERRFESFSLRDCGFGTFSGYGKLDPDISFKKLGAMVEDAAIAPKRL
jgi:hypothetical protein